LGAGDAGDHQTNDENHEEVFEMEHGGEDISNQVGGKIFVKIDTMGM
jgi:hypothetical protein